MMETGNYNINDITLTIGTFNIKEYFKDTDVVVEAVTDKNTQTVGLAGSVVYNVSNDATATVKFSLMPNSPDHKFLTGMIKADTIVPALYSNKATGENMILSGCKLQKIANKGDGKEIGGREWILMVAQAEDIT